MVAGFHTRAVRSKLALTTRCPSGENATLQTTLEWPSSVAITRPVEAFHTRAASVL